MAGVVGALELAVSPFGGSVVGRVEDQVRRRHAIVRKNPPAQHQLNEMKSSHS